MAGSVPTVRHSRKETPTLALRRLRRCRHGKMLYFKQDFYIGRCLERVGEYAMEELEFLGNLVQSGDWIVDGGANIGCHSLHFSKRVGPQGGVLAFEPQRLVFQILCANLALNECENVHAFSEALGNSSDLAFVPRLDYSRPNNFGGVSLSKTGEPVRQTRLDDLGLPRCRLIKLDVEGSEVEALLGMQQTVRRCRPLLYVENDRPERSAELLSLLKTWGYACFRHTPAIVPRDSAVEPELRIFSDNLLCLLAEHEGLAGALPLC